MYESLSQSVSSISSSSTISSVDTIKEIVSSIPNLSQSSNIDITNLTPETLNFRRESTFELVKKLLENREKFLSQFEKGSDKYFIEKVKYNYIKTAVFKAHLEGTDPESFTSRVNQLLQSSKPFQGFLKRHGIDGTDIY